MATALQSHTGSQTGPIAGALGSVHARSTIAGSEDEELHVLEQATRLEESNTQSTPDIHPTAMGIPVTTTAIAATVDSGIDTRTVERHHNHRKRWRGSYSDVEFSKNYAKRRLTTPRPETSIAQLGKESSSEDKVL
jgi:hypothetical protein